MTIHIFSGSLLPRVVLATSAGHSYKHMHCSHRDVEAMAGVPADGLTLGSVSHLLPENGRGPESVVLCSV